MTGSTKRQRLRTDTFGYSRVAFRALANATSYRNSASRGTGHGGHSHIPRFPRATGGAIGQRIRGDPHPPAYWPSGSDADSPRCFRPVFAPRVPAARRRGGDPRRCPQTPAWRLNHRDRSRGGGPRTGSRVHPSETTPAPWAHHACNGSTAFGSAVGAGNVVRWITSTRALRLAPRSSPLAHTHSGRRRRHMPSTGRIIRGPR